MGRVSVSLVLEEQKIEQKDVHGLDILKVRRNGIKFGRQWDATTYPELLSLY